MKILKSVFILIFLLTINKVIGQKDIHEKLVAYETATLEEKMALFFYFAPIFDLEKKDSILYYVNDLTTEGVRSNSQEAIALSNYGIATYLMNASLFEEADAKLTRAENYYLNIHNDTMLAMVYIDLGNSAFLQGNISKAEVYYNKSSAYAINSEDIRFELLSIFNLSRINLYRGKYDIAKEMIEKYINYFSIEEDLGKLTSAFGLMGQLYLAQNDIDSSRNYFTKSMETGMAANDLRAISNGYTNLAIAEYISENTVKSEQYFRVALNYRIKEGNKYYVAEGYYNLGDFYFGIGELDSAIVNHSISLKIAEESNNLIGQKDALTEIAILHDSLNNLEDQISALNKIILVQEKLAKNQSYKEINALKSSYSQSEKEYLNSFGTREDDLQETVFDYESVFRKWAWMIVMSIMLLSGIIYVFRRYQKFKS
ncbi:tetratricopeptide repeat protein [Brumimicrobium mesophilum]|uniref:tetratricopeptide repeat protein n=1 Tax=Brumimicrobium mesophilum TaxID=392717 RepID=UPI000D1436D5|nr:hypothetical protein [Brumimicrobium mesophilum]